LLATYRHFDASGSSGDEEQYQHASLLAASEYLLLVELPLSSVCVWLCAQLGRNFVRHRRSIQRACLVHRTIALIDGPRCHVDLTSLDAASAWLIGVKQLPSQASQQRCLPHPSRANEHDFAPSQPLAIAQQL